jgi:ABC-type branched-subunit amino acid transport system substrate-binding protein
MSLKSNLVASLFAAAIASPIFASGGVDDTSVRFAQIAALDGPAAALGEGMRQGIIAAFEEANKNGGVHGRMLSLESMDDGYEPDQSIQHVRSVISGDNYIGLIGPVGTPTSKAMQPIATEANLPFIGPFTGAGFLRDASLNNVLNVRATYAAETEAWIAHLVDKQGLKNVAILYQDDGFGRVGLAGVTEALDRRGMKLVAEGTYTRNTVAVKSALLGIRKSKPDAVVMVGAYKPIAEFVRLSHKLKFKPEFVTISFVGSKALAADLGPTGEGVIVSQVVPNPWDASIKVVADYQNSLKAVDSAAEPGFVSLEGYIVGRIAVQALENAGADLTREGLMSALSSLGVVDMGGAQLAYGPGDNQGMEEVFLTRITSDGAFEPVN